MTDLINQIWVKRINFEILSQIIERLESQIYYLIRYLFISQIFIHFLSKKV